MKIRKAVIPAAGLGTRFLPATKAQPKEMLPIVDKPAIQYIVEEAVQSGIESILIVTGRNKKSIEDHFDRSVELEQMLSEKGKTIYCMRFKTLVLWPIFIISAKGNHLVWGMPFFVRSNLLVTNRLPFC
ncbi:UTP--glucose-1-phosphate uridylyltransferase domain protein [Desulfosporosinus sp. OT]|nr:UTP--glucose-1-phosphate uridylyltransferase domain protein [Desulfosporosinus sp. OT]